MEQWTQQKLVKFLAKIATIIFFNSRINKTMKIKGLLSNNHILQQQKVSENFIRMSIVDDLIEERCIWHRSHDGCPQISHPTSGVKAEQESSLLYWAPWQNRHMTLCSHMFGEMCGKHRKTMENCRMVNSGGVWVKKICPTDMKCCLCLLLFVPCNFQHRYCLCLSKNHTKICDQSSDHPRPFWVPFR